MNITNRQKRHFRIRKRVVGTTDCPRLAVYRSNAHIYAQIIDDSKGQTVAAVSDLKIKGSSKKADLAYQVGKTVAELAIKKGIKKVVFDRGGYLYHGRVLKLAQGAREGGLTF